MKKIHPFSLHAGNRRDLGTFATLGAALVAAGRLAPGTLFTIERDNKVEFIDYVPGDRA